MAPAIAAAAAEAGLIKCVRLPLPCRPTKLRLDVLATREPSSARSSFIARHIEHPRQTPLKTGIRENLGNAFGFGHFANCHRARNSKCLHAGCNLAALGDSCSFTEVFNAAICA